MTKLTLQLMDTEYKRLEKAAKNAGKSIQTLIHEWIKDLPKPKKNFDVTKDPIFQIEGYDSDAPSDLSVNLDKYLYGAK